MPPHFPFLWARSHFHATYFVAHNCCTISLWLWMIYPYWYAVVRTAWNFSMHFEFWSPQVYQHLHLHSAKECVCVRACETLCRLCCSNIVVIDMTISATVYVMRWRVELCLCREKTHMYLIVLCLDCSDYRLNMTDVTSDVVSGPVGDKAVSALWQLSLALIFKMIVTVFTFGLKVFLTVISISIYCCCYSKWL